MTQEPERFPTMDGKNISVKAYLEREGGQEIRRFGLDSSAATSFEYLQGKLRVVFPSLGRLPFDVRWVDADGDSITVSSDEELVVALVSCLQVGGQQTLRLHVAPRPRAEQPADGPLHCGVSCDGCDQPIRGHRYKCMTCADFDLCAACEGRAAHPEHLMLRIPSPEQVWLPVYRQGRRGSRRPGCPGWAGPPGPRCPRLDRRAERAAEKAEHMASKAEHLASKAEHVAEKRAEKAAQRAAAAGAGAAGAAAGAAADGQQPKNLFEMIHSAMSALGGFAPETSGCPGTTAGRWTEKSLEELGKTIAACLDPFGIDVDVGVETRAARRAAGEPAGPQPKKQQAEEQSQPQTKPQDQPQTKPQDQPQTKPKEQQQQPKAPEQAAASQPEGMELEEADPDPAPAAAGTAIPVTVEDDPNDDWDVVSGTSMASEEAGARPRVYPDLAEAAPPAPADPTPTLTPTLAPAASAPEEPQGPPLEPRIQRALDIMSAMGFTNDGGWLTQLLQAKQGDIGAVLDVLQPVRPRPGQ